MAFVNSPSPWFTEAGAIRAPWRALGFAGLVILASGAIGSIVVPLVQLTSLVDLAREEGLGIAAWWDFLSVLIATALALRLFDANRMSGWGSVGLDRGALRWRVLEPALAAGTLAILLPSALLLQTGHFTIEPSALTGSWIGAVAIAAAQLVPSAFAEELLVRGYLFTAIRDGAGEQWAVAATSMIFGALHAWNPDPSAWSIACVTLAGIFLAVVRLQLNSLYAATLAHLAWNLTQVSLLHAPVSGWSLPAPWYTLGDHGPAWLTGGSWGPEGGVAAALGMLVAIFLLLRRPRVSDGAR
jgi:membrane protease YdiL (CAAX protease family)